MASKEIVGRDAELEAVRTFVEGIADGPRALVLQGEAGAGKTTLLHAGLAAARAAGLPILRSRPAEAEAALSFTVLSDLLDGVADTILPALPQPQRRALEVALLRGAAEGVPADQRAVAVAFLGALRALAAEKPVVVAIDDAQWVDASSESVLAFAMRRLEAEPVRVLLAQRVDRAEAQPLELGHAFADRLETVGVGPLSVGALHRLLQDRLGETFPRPTLLRLHETSDGNPFFALELGRALAQKGAPVGPTGPLPVPAKLRDLLRDRLLALPGETRDMLLIAAALAQPTVSLVGDASGRDPGNVLGPALDAQIVVIEDGYVRFTHTLFAATVIAEAPAATRGALHRLLADAVTDVEERARHLALGTDEPDQEVAVALDEAARHARARGAPGTAAGMASEAIRLTPAEQSADGFRRTLEAAGHFFEAGDATQARALLERAVAAPPSGVEVAHAQTLLARVHTWAGDAREAAELYREALDKAPAPAIGIEANRGVAMALLRILEDLPAAVRHARVATELAEQQRDAAALVNCLSSLAVVEALAALPDASETADRALKIDEATDEAMHPFRSFLTGISGSGGLGLGLILLDRFDDARDLCGHAYARALELGDESSIPLLLGWLSYLDLLAGDWQTAAQSASKAYDAAVQTGQPAQQAIVAGTKALLAAHRGDVEATHRDADEALALADATSVYFRGAILGQWSRGFLELSLGNAAGADTNLRPLVEKAAAAGMRGPGATAFVRDEIEALVALGRTEDAESLLRHVEDDAQRLDHASALAAAARCRGLLHAARGDAEAAIRSFESAVAQHERVLTPFDRARTLFELGSTHRRAKNKRAARDTLEEALDVFERLGARLWSERTRGELNRIGGRAPSRGELTPTEERVAALVAEGRTNRQVAAALFVSERTIEGHLSRIYAKLGVHSRSELTRALMTSGRAATDT
jgi:DNA-binding NarL/FixJ family response regulator